MAGGVTRALFSFWAAVEPFAGVERGGIREYGGGGVDTDRPLPRWVRCLRSIL
jgi:hypothetical protein